ncbi:MAG: argininosuccinate synthase [Clostridiales bacterium]|nr:argininosuccinate synthase [Clostridiales bacterium]
MAKMKVVLAYSGGLDTTIIIPWLKENYDCEVIAVAADVGQGEELAPLNEKAIKSGASKIYIEDLKDEFVKDCIFPTIKAGAVYEGKYLLGTSFARPVIAKRLVEIAKKEKADAICHGCTGKGNDQVRFELTIKALAPDMKIIAPWRIWDIKSRDEEIDYAVARGLDVPVTKKHNYSMDRNLWHLSHEGSDLEDPANEPKDEMLLISKPISETPDSPEYVTIDWVEGEPVAVNGKKLAPVALIETLNEIGARHGVGVDDMVENRLVGMKSRGVYENPAGSILMSAHKNLEELTLDRDTQHFKEHIALKFAELVYDGKWYTPLREALSAFVDSVEKTVTGTTKVKLFKGKITPAGMTSPYSLYDEDIATFGEDEVYDQKDSAGFINLFGLPLKVRAKMLERVAKKNSKK